METQKIIFGQKIGEITVFTKIFKKIDDARWNMPKIAKPIAYNKRVGEFPKNWKSFQQIPRKFQNCANQIPLNSFKHSQKV